MGVSSVSEHVDDWDEFLSSGAKLSEADLEATNRVLGALKLEREGVADGSPWAQYLSSAAQLSDTDARAVQPALQAVRLARQQARRWRLNVTRFVAGAAAAVAVVAAVSVFSPSASADPSDAYSAYQEAARGW